LDAEAVRNRPVLGGVAILTAIRFAENRFGRRKISGSNLRGKLVAVAHQWSVHLFVEEIGTDGLQDSMTTATQSFSKTIN
jgi:hypothetical protein